MPNDSKLISASKFKVHCLECIENVRTSRDKYIITKRNKPIAKLVPLSKVEFCFGKMKGSASIKGDLIDPIKIDWKAGLLH